MNKYLVFVLLILPSYCYALMNPYMFGITTTASSSGVDLSDDFNRTDSSDLGSDWSEYSQGAQIVSNELQLDWVDSQQILVLNTNDTGSTIQYGKISLAGSQDVGLIFRSASDGTGYKYIIRSAAGDNAIAWEVFSGTAWSSTVGPTSITHSTSDTVAVVMTGSGTDTVLNIWISPTNNTPFSSGSSCTNTAKPCWDNAGDAPDAEDASDPANLATGQYMGVTAKTTSSEVIDDFYGGGL